MLDSIIPAGNGHIADLYAQAIQPDVVLRFDYDSIDDVRDRELLRAAAVKIRQVVDNARWVVGDQLIQVKRHVSHGHWLAWLRGEWDWSEKTAQNYMNAARLIESGGPEYAKLNATAQALLGGQDAELVATVGPELLDLQQSGGGSGRNGAVNVADVKAAVNRAAGRQVYTDDAPPVKSDPPPVAPRATSFVAPAAPVYTGDVRPIHPFTHGCNCPDCRAETAAAIAQTEVDRVAVVLPVALARTLRDATAGGALCGFLTDDEEGRLVDALDSALAGVA